MTSQTVSPTVIDTLRASVTGELITPDSADYDAARRVYSGTADLRPALDLRGLDDITIDPAARVARAGAGLTTGEFVAAAGEHGLTTGLGLLSRTLGLTIDSLLGADVVTADGELL